MPSPAPADLSSALLGRALGTAPIIVWAIDAAGTYTLSEGHGLELLGMRPGEAVGLSALEMFRDNPPIASAFVRALAGEETHALTSPAPGLRFRSWYAPLRGPDGKVSGAACVSVEVSEQSPIEPAARSGVTVIDPREPGKGALTTPIIQVWDGVLCVPVIGTVDSSRTADMMQGLLEAIVKEQARHAIVDLTGVEVVDTSTADHLVQLFRAARVLGVEGVLCGIRPAVAQTIVGLGLDLGSVKTTRTLRDALKWCIRARGESLGSDVAPANGGPRS
jgi:rsbT co-antagonist protein RsbR